jgi:hypothetical protein
MGQKNMVMSAAERGTKNECADEGQQQFTQMTDRLAEELDVLALQ